MERIECVIRGSETIGVTQVATAWLEDKKMANDRTEIRAHSGAEARDSNDLEEWPLPVG
jgi:hypothetical protein